MRHHPRKRYGQHFLHDPAIIRRIVDAVNPQRGDTLIEVGPGMGAITEPLLARTGQLTIIEVDRDLCQRLRDRYTDKAGLVLIEADVLSLDFRQLATDARLRFVGNLPYNISTPLLFHLLDQIDCVQDMHFMLQKEVVTRMAASAGTRDYGRLSVMLARFCRVEPLFDIGPGAFQPAPRVTSTFVRLIPHREPPFLVKNDWAFAEVVRQAFSMRRKTLRNALRGLLDEKAIVSAGIDPGARAETLIPEQFARMSNVLASSELTPSTPGMRL